MVCILSIDGGLKNCGFVSLNINDNKINIISAELLNFCRDKKVKQVKFEDVMKNMIETLNTKYFDNINLVLIENIPSRLNQKTKSLSVAMYAYFMIKNIEVKFVSPSRKLSKEQNKLSYKERKAESVKKCMNLLSEDDQIMLNKYKKVDDLTDSVLQAVEYFKKQKKTHFSDLKK